MLRVVGSLGSIGRSYRVGSLNGIGVVSCLLRWGPLHGHGVLGRPGGRRVVRLVGRWAAPLPQGLQGHMLLPPDILILVLEFLELSQGAARAAGAAAVETATGAEQKEASCSCHVQEIFSYQLRGFKNKFFFLLLQVRIWCYTAFSLSRFWSTTELEQSVLIWFRTAIFHNLAKNTPQLAGLFSRSRRRVGEQEQQESCKGPGDLSHPGAGLGSTTHLKQDK